MIGFKEGWLQNAIASNPELVIAPCRQAGLTDERWVCWAREVQIRSAGSVDVLLLSESGRIGIVETKLAYNPEARRAVVAQALEYAISLPLVDKSDLPEIPKTDGAVALIDWEDVQEKLQEPLVIIAGDQLDPRVIKLSNAILGKHVIHGWELALVEVAVYEKGIDGKKEHLVAPHLSGAVKVEQRQVLKVVIDEKRTQVEVETAGLATENRQKWDEERFFSVAVGSAIPIRNFANNLRELQNRFSPDVSFDFGTSKDGAVVLKRRGKAILEFRLDGRISFRPDRFVDALGQDCGLDYRSKLDALFPVEMQQTIPVIRTFSSQSTDQLLNILCEVLTRTGSEAANSQTAPVS
jgi:hypothetical protein